MNTSDEKYSDGIHVSSTKHSDYNRADAIENGNTTPANLATSYLLASGGNWSSNSNPILNDYTLKGTVSLASQRKLRDYWLKLITLVNKFHGSSSSIVSSGSKSKSENEENLKYFPSSTLYSSVRDFNYDPSSQCIIFLAALRGEYLSMYDPIDLVCPLCNKSRKVKNNNIIPTSQSNDNTPSSEINSQIDSSTSFLKSHIVYIDEQNRQALKTEESTIPGNKEEQHHVPSVHSVNSLVKEDTEKESKDNVCFCDTKISPFAKLLSIYAIDVSFLLWSEDKLRKLTSILKSIFSALFDENYSKDLTSILKDLNKNKEIDDLTEDDLDKFLGDLAISSDNSKLFPRLKLVPLLSETWLLENGKMNKITKEDILLKERKEMSQNGVLYYSMKQGIHDDKHCAELVFSYAGKLFHGWLKNIKYGGFVVKEIPNPIPEYQRINVQFVPCSMNEAIYYVRNKNIYMTRCIKQKVLDSTLNKMVETENWEETQLTTCKTNDESNGIAEYIIQEEFGRYCGFYGNPNIDYDSRTEGEWLDLVYFNVDEKEVDDVVISDITFKYPFAWKKNAKNTLCWLRIWIGNNYINNESIEETINLKRKILKNGRDGNDNRKTKSFLVYKDEISDAYITSCGWIPGNKNVFFCNILNRGQNILSLYFYYRLSNGDILKQLVYRENTLKTINYHVNISNAVYFFINPGNNNLNLIWPSELSGYMHLYLINLEICDKTILLAKRSNFDDKLKKYVWDKIANSRTFFSTDSDCNIELFADKEFASPSFIVKKYTQQASNSDHLFAYRRRKGLLYELLGVKPDVTKFVTKKTQLTRGSWAVSNNPIYLFDGRIYFGAKLSPLETSLCSVSLDGNSFQRHSLLGRTCSDYIILDCFNIKDYDDDLKYLINEKSNQRSFKSENIKILHHFGLLVTTHSSCKELPVITLARLSKLGVKEEQHSEDLGKFLNLSSSKSISTSFNKVSNTPQSDDAGLSSNLTGSGTIGRRSSFYQSTYSNNAKNSKKYLRKGVVQRRDSQKSSIISPRILPTSPNSIDDELEHKFSSSASFNQLVRQYSANQEKSFNENDGLSTNDMVNSTFSIPQTSTPGVYKSDFQLYDSDNQSPGTEDFEFSFSSHDISKTEMFDFKHQDDSDNDNLYYEDQSNFDYYESNDNNQFESPSFNFHDNLEFSDVGTLNGNEIEDVEIQGDYDVEVNDDSKKQNASSFSIHANNFVKNILSFFENKEPIEIESDNDSYGSEEEEEEEEDIYEKYNFLGDNKDDEHLKKINSLSFLINKTTESRTIDRLHNREYGKNNIINRSSRKHLRTFSNFNLADKITVRQCKIGESIPINICNANKSPVRRSLSVSLNDRKESMGLFFDKKHAKKGILKQTKSKNKSLDDIDDMSPVDTHMDEVVMIYRHQDLAYIVPPLSQLSLFWPESRSISTIINDIRKNLKDDSTKYEGFSNKDAFNIISLSKMLKNFTDNMLTIPKWIRIRSGSELISAYLYLPPKKKEPYNLILRVYGGPNVQIVQNLPAPRQIQLYLEAGFAVLSVDGRGSGGRGVRFEKPILDRPDIAIDDHIKVLRAVREEYAFSSVSVVGWSFGGYLALRMIEEYPFDINKCVSGAPVTDWSLYDSAFTERYLPNGNQKISVDKIPNGRVLFVHGLCDENVHFEHTKKLSNELSLRNIEHYVQVYPDQRHGLIGKSLRHYEALAMFWCGM